MSLPSKGGLKNVKPGLNDRASNVGKAASQVGSFAVSVIVENEFFFLTVFLLLSERSSSKGFCYYDLFSRLVTVSGII